MMTTKLIATNSMPTQLEILAMAQELLVDHYNEEKDKVLTQWREMTELVLNTTGDLIEYPELPEYPSCDEIMSLARHLNAHFTEINGEYHASDSDDHSVMPESGCMPEPTPVIDNNGAVENSDGPVEPPAQPA
jgi:hypothetical protein